MTAETENPQLPTSAEILLKTPLYDTFDVSGQNSVIVQRLKLPVTLDAYCIECKQNSIFTRILMPDLGVSAARPSMRPSRSAFIPLPEKQTSNKDEIFHIRLNCNRNYKHRIDFIFQVQDDILVKIGQFLSLADLQLKDIDKYDKILDETSRKEFARAIGLYAHGIGIGAFVYLRRIFERLIEDAHRVASNDKGWNEEAFKNARMDERITILSGYLPQFLVANASVYSILSQGIHTLTEEQCYKFFPTVKLAIELILDEKHEKMTKEKTVENLQKELSKIRSDLK